LIKPIKNARTGWQAAFRKVAEKRDDYSIDMLASDWDKGKWDGKSI
jgi:hypothetical protein